MARRKSVNLFLAVVLSGVLMAGLCFGPAVATRAGAAETTMSQCGELIALSLISSIGDALWDAASSAAKEWAIGSVMGAMGFGEPTTKDIMKALNQGMDEIMGELDTIKGTLGTIIDMLKDYFDEKKMIDKYNDFTTQLNLIKTAYDNWVLLRIEPYNGTASDPRIPPKPGEPGYDNMKEDLDSWANGMNLDTYDVFKAIGQIHFDLIDPVNSILKDIVDMAIDIAGTEWGGQDFATTVRSTNGVPVVTDRVMYTRGELSGVICGGESMPGKEHHFAEGYVSRGQDSDTRGETFILIQNTSEEKTANTRITFFMGAGENKVLDAEVPPNSRYTVNCGDHVTGEFGIKVESDTDVAVERSSYLDGKFAGSTVNADVGVNTRKTFAEGYVMPDYFHTYFTIMNPDPGKAAKVNAIFSRFDGSTEQTTIDVGPGRRATIDAGNHIQGEFSTIVESTNGVPVVSERAVYASGGIGDRVFSGATVSAGETSLSNSRFFAEGYVVPGYFDTYFTLINPQAKEAVATFSFMKGDGTIEQHQAELAPGKRVTVNAGDFLSGEFATGIESSEPISTERITYARSVGGGTLLGANIGRGAEQAKTEWTFAEGTNRKHLGAKTYLTIANPGTKTAQLEVTFRTSEGEVYRKNISVPPRGATGVSSNTITKVSGAGGRVTVDVGAEVRASVIDQYYGYLEDMFVGSVYQKQQGANLVVEFRKYLNDKDVSYWLDDFLEKEQQEVQTFLSQAYRLAMSQTDLVEQPGIEPFPEDARSIIKRANFVANIINNKCDYDKPDDPDYPEDLANQNRLFGTVILDGELAGSTDTVSISCTADGAPELSGNGIWQTGYVEKYRSSTGQRVREYYDSWQGNTMTPRNDFSVFTFSIPGVVGGKTYDLSLSINGNLYYTGRVASQSTDPEGQPYDPQKSVAQIDTLPIVYYFRTGGFNKVADLVRQTSQFTVVKNYRCNPAQILVDDGGYLLNGTLEDQSLNDSCSGTIQRTTSIVLNASADNNMKSVYVYPYCRSMRYMDIKHAEGVTSWNLLNSLSGYDHLTSQGHQHQTRGGNWSDYWGKGYEAYYDLPDKEWNMNMQLNVDSGPINYQAQFGSAKVYMYVQVTGFSFGFY